MLVHKYTFGTFCQLTINRLVGLQTQSPAVGSADVTLYWTKKRRFYLIRDAAAASAAEALFADDDAFLFVSLAADRVDRANQHTIFAVSKWMHFEFPFAIG